jgi:hypothetical protein
MRMHLGRKVAALGLTTLAVGGAAGTALAASGGSGTPTSAASAAPVPAVQTDAQQPALTKMTMTQLTEKLGVSEKQMIFALDDMKTHWIKSKVSDKGTLQNVLASDLGISGSAAQWVVEEIDGGYVPTYRNWGF